MKSIFKKKASLELSINAIVIVVLAFVMLGLGLGFVKSQFSGFEETAGSVQETVKQQILDQMREGNKKLSFPAQRLKIERNKKEDIAIGVKNVLDKPLDFVIAIYTQKDEAGESEECVPDFSGSDLESIEIGCDPIGEIAYFYDSEIQTLDPTEANVYGIGVTPKGGTGTYMAKIVLLNLDDTDAVEVYNSKTFFIEVI